MPRERLRMKDRTRRFPLSASAGGLEAFNELLHAVPGDTGMAFVLVQHLDPSHGSMLTEIMSRATAMPLSEVRGETRVLPNHVYVGPPGMDLTIDHGVLKIAPRTDTWHVSRGTAWTCASRSWICRRSSDMRWKPRVSSSRGAIKFYRCRCPASPYTWTVMQSGSSR